MKINSIQQQNNFRGSIADKSSNFIAKHPMFIAGLAGSSVIAQKIIMSGSEAVIGPAMDIATGKAITKITKEEDGRTNQSSKTQAIRTVAQAVGGTITGVIIRGAAIAACVAGLAKAGGKAGGKIAEIINKNQEFSSKENLYLYKENASAWGKTLGGAVAIIIMMVTNFVIDAPFVNWINKKMTELLGKDKSEKGGNK